MSLVDKLLQCLDFGTNFTFSAEKQELFATKGYTNEPKRFLSCRQEKRAQHNNGFDDSSSPRFIRQMFLAVCAECGMVTQVPFEPREGRPVYCSRCYDKVRVSSHR